VHPNLYITYTTAPPHSAEVNMPVQNAAAAVGSGLRLRRQPRRQTSSCQVTTLTRPPLLMMAMMANSAPGAAWSWFLG